MTFLRIGELDDGAPAGIDLEAKAEEGLRVFICGGSGSGKGYTLGVCIEELHDAGLPVVMIDPESELWTFQEIGALVVGGPHGDAPLPDDDDLLERLMRHALATAGLLVFDLGGVRRARQAVLGTRLAGLFWQLMDLERQSAVLAVTEAHLFAPQSISPQRGPLEGRADFGILAEFASAGRKRGVISLFETQRPARIQKDVVDLCNVRLIGRLDGTADYDQVKRHLPGVAFAEMRTLGRGRFYMTGYDVPVGVRARRVTHGGGSPAERESIQIARPHEPAQDVAELLAALRAAAEPAASITSPQGPQRGSSRRGHADYQDLEQQLEEARRAGAERLASDTATLTAARDQLAAANAALEAAGARLAVFERLGRDLRAVLGGPLEGTVAVAGGLDEGRVLELIRQHAPAGGGGRAPVLPVERLRQDFLEEAAGQLLERLQRGLSAEVQKVVLFVLTHSQGAGPSMTAIARGLGGPSATGGEGFKRWRQAVTEACSLGYVEQYKSNGDKFRPAIEKLLRAELAPHEPTAEELAGVVDRALYLLQRPD